MKTLYNTIAIELQDNKTIIYKQYNRDYTFKQLRAYNRNITRGARYESIAAAGDLETLKNDYKYIGYDFINMKDKTAVNARINEIEKKRFYLEMIDYQTIDDKQRARALYNSVITLKAIKA